MKYIVFDLEFNQGFNKNLNKTVSNEKCPFEILQIGALKLDSHFNIIDTFNSYVKPTLYENIHPYIGRMTKITYDDVKYSPPFTEVYEQFLDFIGSKEEILCVWGTSDLKELHRNINYYGLSSSNLPKKYINVQHYASRYFKNPAGKSIGLQNAINLLDLDEDKSYHDALNDAYYTSLVFMRIYNPTMAFELYNYTPLRPDKSKGNNKKYINYDKLFKEFKKILNRDLTKDEKKIIDLAYKMGKTNQFLESQLNIKKR